MAPNNAVIVFAFPEPEHSMDLGILIDKSKAVFSKQPEVKVYMAVSDAATSVITMLTSKKSKDRRDFDFIVGEDEELTLETAVFQALGAASTCWDTMSGAGVFHSEEARDIGKKLIQFIRENS